MKTRILIRADDLGYSEGVNHGIAKSALEGVAGSIGLMVNMPATEHGVRLLKGSAACIGLHTNICAGMPLTDPALIPSIVQANGEFKPSSAYRSATSDFVVLKEVLLEIEAQYRRFKELMGREPEYFECHAVASANFFTGLEIVAERHSLKYSPMPVNSDTVTVGNTKVRIGFDAMRPDYDPQASLKKLVETTEPGACSMMICHPGYLDAYILRHSSLTTPRALEAEMLSSEETREFLEESRVELITYNDL